LAKSKEVFEAAGVFVFFKERAEEEDV